MGERVQKIAFLVFALLFVAIMAILNTSILTLATGANTQLTSVLSSDDSSLTIYDQGKVYGATVISCAKDPGNVSETVKSIFVVTANNLAGSDYRKGVTVSATNTSGTVNRQEAYETTASSAVNYVNRSAKYRSYLCENSNHVVTGILFIQEGAAPSAAQLNTLCKDSGGNTLSRVGL